MRVVYISSFCWLKVLTLYFTITIVLCNYNFVIGMDNDSSNNKDISNLKNNNNIRRRLLDIPVAVLLTCIYNGTELRNSINSASTDPTKKPKVMHQCVPNIVLSNSGITANGINLSNKKIDLRCGVAGRYGCTINGNGNRIFYGSTTQLNVTGIDFINGNSPSLGGALSFEKKSNVTLNKCSFRNNKASQWGGAIAIKNASTLVVNGGGGSGSVFSNNRAWSGGAIHVQDYSTLTINGLVTFMNNTAFYKYYQSDAYDEPMLLAGSGGAISLLHSPKATMTNVSFIGNTADKGGAIHNSFGTNIDINMATFTNNMANHTGAISFTFVESSNMKNVSFIGNSALINNGGAIDSWFSKIYLQDCVFAKNTQPVNSVGNNIHISQTEISDSNVDCKKTTFCDVNGLNDTSIFDKTTNGGQSSKCKYAGIVQTPGVGICPA